MNDIICHKVISITEDGITLEYKTNKIYICFEDCAKNFAMEKNVEFSKCIATRNINTLSFTFYTQPKTKIFFKRCFLNEFIQGKSAISKFLALQKAITEAGYTSYDLS